MSSVSDMPRKEVLTYEVGQRPISEESPLGQAVHPLVRGSSLKQASGKVSVAMSRLKLYNLTWQH